MKYTMSEAVHVDLRVDGEDYSGDYGPGDVDLPGPVAELLAAQGLLGATEPRGKGRRGRGAIDPAEASATAPEPDDDPTTEATDQNTEEQP